MHRLSTDDGIDHYKRQAVWLMQLQNLFRQRRGVSIQIALPSTTWRNRRLLNRFGCVNQLADMLRLPVFGKITWNAPDRRTLLEINRA